MSELNDREQSLVALGAAIAANCLQCIEYHVPAARKTGLSDLAIKEAARIADKVRRVPAHMVMQAVLARVEDGTATRTDPPAAGCGCGGASEPGCAS